MIHVVGNAAIDTIFRVDRFPLPGETIVAADVSEDLGGKGANQAVMARRTGAKVRLVAAVGDDPAGARIRAVLGAEGVLTDGLVVWPGSTDRSSIYVDAGGENTIVSVTRAAQTFDPLADGKLVDVEPDDVVLCQGNLAVAVLAECLLAARSRGAATVLNPSPLFPARDFDWSRVDTVVLNEVEARALSGNDDSRQGARRLRDAGVRDVVVTLGHEGAAMIGSECIEVRGSASRGDRHDRRRRRLLRRAHRGPRRGCALAGSTRRCGQGGRDRRDASRRLRRVSERRGNCDDPCGRIREGNALKTPLLAHRRENALAAIFGRADRVLIGMVHLLPLPGSPDYDGGGVATIMERALADAAAYVSAGFDGLMVENHGDIPFLKPERIGPETAAHMAVVADRVRQASQLPVGINVLANAALHALAVAAAAQASFVRVNQWANAYVANEGIIEGAAADALRYRSALRAPAIRIFADAHVKHGAHAIVQDRPLEELVRDVEFFSADAVIATGQRTGHAADIGYIRKIRQATSLPLLVGSGVTPGNVASILTAADGVIVGSALKLDGVWWNAVDPQAAKAFAARAREGDGANQS